MKTSTLTDNILAKRSFLCVGLDVDLTKVPKHLLDEQDPIFAFNKAVIDATNDLVVAYKPNTAFYEAHGVKGWESLQRTMRYLHLHHPDIYTIADAKRGDIGNTSRMYAKAFFEDMGFDSVTVAPYMGRDSVEPFLEYEGKHVILLALTSNAGSLDFQTLQVGDMPLYKKVLQTSQKWNNAHNLMYVAGATQAAHLKEVRELVPDNFLLIPGVGAQGGSLEEVCANGLNDSIGLLVNTSRNVLYASSGVDFAQAARREALGLKHQMEKVLSSY